MDLEVNFESSENFIINPSTKLKDFINNDVPSLNFQVAEQDYFLKFNNNPLPKLLMNNQIKDLIGKFLGNRIEITPTHESLEEIKNLTENCGEKHKKFKEICDKLSNIEIEYLKKINFDLLEKKFYGLIRKLDDKNSYYQKAKAKIIKRIKLYDEMFKQSDKSHLTGLLISECFVWFIKIINYCFTDVMNYFYKYGHLFLNNINYLNLYNETLIKIFFQFFKILNEDVTNSIESNESTQDFFIQLDNNIVNYRIFQNTSSQPISMVFFSFEEPIQLNISEIEYKEIKGLLANFPSLESFKNSYRYLTNDQLLIVIFKIVLERDIRIYHNYGIKMEDFIYATLLYEN